MKRPLYYLLCAIACTSMVGATMPMAAIAEAIQPPATAEQQAQADATNSDIGKAEDGASTNATADTVEDSTATSTGTSAVSTESAGDTTAATPGPPAATGTPTPSLLAQTSPTPETISTTSQTGYAHSATASQNGVTFTVSWNDAPAGTATTFHVTQTSASSQAKARMDVPTSGTAAARKASATRRARHGPATTAFGPALAIGPKESTWDHNSLAWS